MIRAFRQLFCLFLIAVPASSGSRLSVDPVVPHAITLVAVPLVHPIVQTELGLVLRKGWVLTSKDANFGGLSALTTDGHNFIALSDAGLFVKFGLSDDGQISNARIDPLPAGCAKDQFKSDRDSESMTRDPATGNVWIGFEWRNAICRTDAGMKRATGAAMPEQMRGWERTTGPEAMVRLADGRFLVIAERPTDGRFVGPALLFPSDPAVAGTRAKLLAYQDPAPYFRPTDAAQLPDGRLLVLHRNFKPPFRFRGRLAIVDAIPRTPPKRLLGRIIASFDEKGLTDNFEGVAVSQEGARTFVWLVSDDNYLWLQHTYLLKFELLANAPAE